MILNKLHTKCVFLVLFVFGFQDVVVSQQISELPNGVQGFWTEDSSKKTSLNNWKAQWIWMEDSVQSDVMLARRSFELDEIPEEALLRITASSKYELFLNGKAVCQGPARSAPHHQSFDILDVKSILNTGKNTIAVRVHFQKGKVSYHLKGRAGLLVQLDLNNNGSSSAMISDKKWKVHPDESWNNDSKVMGRFQLVQNDHIDFSKKIIGFETVTFDDSKWDSAKPLLRNSGWPAPKKNEKATTLTTPWTSLVPRDIPYLNENEIEATQLIEARRMEQFDIKKPLPQNAVVLNGTIQKDISKNLKDYLTGKQSLELSPSKENETWFLLFDFGKVINGMPRLVVEGTQNTEVHILEAPYIIDQKFTHKIVDSEFHDRLILSGKKDTWQSMYFKPTRYLAIAVKGNKETVKIHSLGIHQLSYPFELKGSISTPEAPWVEDLWSASAKTIDVCTTDAFTDNYRERRQYAQTGYYAALGNYFTYGDFSLQKRYLIQVAQEQEANGLMPAYAPLASDDYMVILDSNCLWIRSLYNYYMYSGDVETVKRLLPAAQKLMHLLYSFTNEAGLIDSPPYSYWLDHTLNDRRGANLCLNGHYLGALEDFSQLLKWMSLTEESSALDEQVQDIRQFIATNFWDDEKQLFADAFIDGKRSDQFSEHANAMALAGKIASEQQAALVAKQLLLRDNHNFVKRANGMTMVSPAMSYFLYKGLANYGYEEASLHMLNQRFSHMLKPETNGTLWEESWLDGSGRTGEFIGGRTRSDAQTESVFPPALFANYILGLEVTKAGMTEMKIVKPSTTLKSISGEIPTPQGLFKMDWNFGETNSLMISIPENMNVKVDLDSFNIDGKKEILLNGQKITETEILELSNGAHKIDF